MKLTCPVVENVGFRGCKDNHLHVILFSEDGKDIAELVIHTIAEYNDFAIALGLNAQTAFQLQAMAKDNILQ
jgi:hypothetical protein